MIDVTAIRARTEGHAMIRSVDQVAKGHVRLETAFLYPDGASVDVFVIDEAPLLPPTRLSDLGQTMNWLFDVQVKPLLSKKRRNYLEDTLRLHNVSQNQGALEIPLGSLDELVPGVVRLGQTCLRVADLTFTRRTALQAAVTEELEEVISDTELTYEQNPELEGRFGKLVRVDFLVHGAHVESALLALSSGNPSQAHTQANEIFRRWYDLNVPDRPEHRLTVFDDRVDVYREEDLRRLRDLSDVVALSDRRSLADLLAA